MLLIIRMDNTSLKVRGWRESLALDNAVEPLKRQGYSLVVEEYLMAAEKRGWAVGVGTAKDYIELVEEARGVGERWEEGREALRWLVRFGKRVKRVASYERKTFQSGGGTGGPIRGRGSGGLHADALQAVDFQRIEGIRVVLHGGFQGGDDWR